MKIINRSRVNVKVVYIGYKGPIFIQGIFWGGPNGSNGRSNSHLTHIQ